MKFLKTAFLLPIVLITVVVSASGQTNTQTDTWKSYTSEACGFTAAFPETPTEEKQIVPTALGDQEMIVVGCDASELPSSPNLAYIATYSEYSTIKFSANDKEALAQYFRGAVDGMVSNTDGKLLSETTIDMDGIPGREVRIGLGNEAGVLTARLYLSHNKSYVLVVVTGAENDRNTSIARFFNSFRVLTTE